MPQSRKNGSARSSTTRRKKGARAANRRNTRATRSDAISLLKQDHREVEGWFRDFEKTNSDSKKQQLAQQICTALKAHTAIEEEIFYPAFLEATDETDIHHEAEVEHDGAKKLIEEIEAGGPDDDYFDARVSVLSEMIKHHVKEEEKRGGMFSKARQADMDLEELGRQLQQRKEAFMAEQPQQRRAADGERAPMAGRGGRRRGMMSGRNSRGREEQQVARRT